MGHVFARGRVLWLAYKGPDGKRVRRPSPFRVGDEKQAEKLLQRVEERIAAGRNSARLSLGR